MATRVGEAASILGILGVTGQAVESASTLYTFCKAYKQVHSELENTTREVQCLVNVLFQLEHCLPPLLAAECPVETINAIQREMVACREDLARWTQKIDSLDLSAAKGTMLKKVKIAADKSYFAGMRGQLSSHRELITALMTVLGSYVTHLRHSYIPTNALYLQRYKFTHPP
jgi:hypothetical protein